MLAQGYHLLPFELSCSAQEACKDQWSFQLESCARELVSQLNSEAPHMSILRLVLPGQAMDGIIETQARQHMSAVHLSCCGLSGMNG